MIKICISWFITIFSVLFYWCDKDRERREIQTGLLSIGSLPKHTQQLALGCSWSQEPETGNSVQVSHVGGRQWVPCTSTCCLPGYASKCLWSWEPEPGFKSRYSNIGWEHLNGQLLGWIPISIFLSSVPLIQTAKERTLLILMNISAFEKINTCAFVQF